MPTYRNDKTSGDMLIEGVDGEPIRLAPGETGESYIFYDRDDLTKTLDAPLWTPYVAGPKTITAAAAGTEAQAIDPATVRLRILSVSDGITVSVRLHSAADYVPAHEMVPAITNDDCPYDILTAGRVANMHFVFSAAGEIVIAEM